jgi:hypothetical protein
MHRIFITEPSTFNSLNATNLDIISINDHIYQNILNGPSHSPSDSDENAYVFGPLFNLNEYIHVSSHGNDGAQIGLIDADILDQRSDLNWSDNLWSQIDYDYNDQSKRDQVRSINPAILFFGETIGGDVGADLYAHYGTNEQIDSLIIDNSYFFNVHTHRPSNREAKNKAKTEMENSKALYKTWKYAHDIINMIDDEYDSPLSDESEQYAAIPVSQFTVNIPRSTSININIQPDPVAIARSMNVQLSSTPTEITVKATVILHNKILRIISCNIQDGLEYKTTNVIIPDSIAKEISKQIKARVSIIASIMDINEHQVIYISFNMHVYWVIPLK